MLGRAGGYAGCTAFLADARVGDRGVSVLAYAAGGGADVCLAFVVGTTGFEHDTSANTDRKDHCQNHVSVIAVLGRRVCAPRRPFRDSVG